MKIFCKPIISTSPTDYSNTKLISTRDKYQSITEITRETNILLELLI